MYLYIFRKFFSYKTWSRNQNWWQDAIKCAHGWRRKVCCCRVCIQFDTWIKYV